MALTKKEQQLIQRQIARAKEVEYLSCRIGGDGHKWERVQPDITPSHGKAIVHQCSECLGIRRRVVSPKYGEILSETRQYPQGYLARRSEGVPKGERLISASAVRVATLDVDESTLRPVVEVLT